MEIFTVSKNGKDFKLESIRELPFGERVQMFFRASANILAELGEDKNPLLDELITLTVASRLLGSEEERKTYKKEKLAPIYEKLGEAGRTNPRVGRAITRVNEAERQLFLS